MKVWKKMNCLSFVVNEVPPTINKYIGRTNRWEYQNDKKRYSRMVKYSVLNKYSTIKKCKKCNIEVVYYFKTRIRHDPSNYDKFLLDALVDSEIIEDDNYDVIKRFTTIGSYDKENPRVEINIEVLE